MKKQLNVEWRKVALAMLGLAGVCAAILCILYGAHPARVQAQAKAEYVDPSLCTGCHADISATYRQTGMGRSFYRVNASDRTVDFTTHNTLYNKASDRYYMMLERDGKLYEQRYQAALNALRH